MLQKFTTIDYEMETSAYSPEDDTENEIKMKTSFEHTKEEWMVKDTNETLIQPPATAPWKPPRHSSLP